MPRTHRNASDYDEPLLAVELEALRSFMFVLLRYRWIVAAVMVGVLAVTCIGTLLRTPLYRSSALLRIDRGRLNVVEDLTEEDRFLGSREFYGTQQRILTSRMLAERTMDRLDVWNHELLRVDDPGVRDVREAQVKMFLEMLGATVVRDTQLLDVSFTSPDPTFTRDVTNAHAREYIAHLTDTESGVARSTSSFIGEQVEKLQRDIQQKEMLLRQYGEQHDVVLEQSDEILAQQFSELHHELTRAQSQLAAAEARHQSLRQTSPESNPDVFNNPTIQRLRQELSTLKKEYAELGTKFEPRWPEMQRKQSAIEEIESRLEIETNDLARKLAESARADAQSAANRVANLKRTLEQQRRESRDLNARTSDYDRIRLELESQRAMLQNLTRREGETGFSADLEQRQNIKVGLVEQAVLPVEPYSPNLLMNLLLGGLVGLVLGPSLALFLSFWDTAIHNVDDLKRYASAPCLAMIPHFAREKAAGPTPKLGPGRASKSLAPSRSRSTELVGPRRTLARDELTLEKTELLERFKFLRNALVLSSPDHPPKIVLVTSGSEREGKSFVASNFAASYAQLDKKVLLIDADLRRPSVHNFFGLRNKVGLTNVIVGQRSLVDGTVQATNVANLYVLLAGSQSPSPSELLSSDAMTSILEESSAHFDLIVIDSAPLFPVVDTHSLAARADRTMLVVRSGSTRGPAVKDALQLLEQSQGKVAGVVLNDIDLMDFAQSYYYRHSSYSYAPESQDRVGA